MTAPEPSILRVRNLRKAFGGLRAVDGCSLDVRRGSITGLIGPNGAGKTTLFNTIAGLYSPDDGEIWLGTRRIDGLPPHLIVRRGLIKTWQVPKEFKSLPVLDNVILGAVENRGEHLVDLVFRFWEAWQEEGVIEEQARRILEIVGLQALAEEPAKTLSGGQKKLLELARALMSKPSVILLDEPMAGVHPVLARQLLDLLGRLREQGHTFFLIEHDMDMVMSRCDWIVVMHEGRKIAEGKAEQVRHDPAVLESYLGG